MPADLPPDSSSSPPPATAAAGSALPPDAFATTPLVRTFQALLDLEPLEVNLFRGRNPPADWLVIARRVFGGQVLAQALVAAQRTVEGIAAHSLHGYFLLTGDPQAPIVYQVERIRDGRSFATRRVVAVQHGRPIFIMSASFHREEPGFEHSMKLPAAVPEPEDIPPMAERGAALEKLPELVRAYWTRVRPIELRPVHLGRPPGAANADPRQFIWFRTAGPLPDVPELHRAMLAYTSDMTLLETTLIEHETSVFNDEILAASLDHALWLHRPFRIDDWLLYAQDSPAAGGGRGLARGLIYDRAGRLVASVAQEGLIRPRAVHK
ncbi:acyl-CoA thioesterase [Ancylobacter lacus]|uniref:acyl-CoA thioesterase n=1 Tax=Ancylobacter lacus TaxID=2579970 RepID=UPI001BCEB53A|nr:acyl-CoA thioesterase II [Ancylobacter lacus]MBS7537711.1 acyl-CoA thioesterase II [Ancylobacter lacus]